MRGRYRYRNKKNTDSRFHSNTIQSASVVESYGGYILQQLDAHIVVRNQPNIKEL
ncbi:MAG: hypothetical protein WBF33_19705 [Candidatus Nitrosopolaris sp.]